jgi:hypothetical protein
MLKLVESLATKAERAKSTTVEFSPLISDAYARKCDWCERFTTSPKGWVSYRAVEKTKRGGLDVAGHICTDAECRLSIQARYSATAES